MELKIEYVELDKLKPYEKNARKHQEADLSTIKASISEFGMSDPIGVWGKDNIIVEGHGRYLACKKLGIDKVPVIHLDHLTDEQRRAYTLAHNKTAEMSEWDFDLLGDELADIFDIDMSDFGFDLPEDEEEPEDKEKHNEAERTGNAYNLSEYDEDNVAGFYQMPVIDPCNYIPDDIIGFNYALTSKNKDCGIHFYIDDYQFERIWAQPQLYLEKLSEYQCIFTPDFSLYTDMPIAMKIWNTYRSRLIGQIAQRMGMLVIPTVSWCEEATFDFCFDGLPVGATLSISTIGVKQDDYNFNLWKAGVDEMIKRLKPKTLLIYGGKVDYDYDNIKVIYFENKVTERMKQK